jgi:hypothetical protein
MKKILSIKMAVAIPAAMVLALFTAGCKDYSYFAPTPVAGPRQDPMPPTTVTVTPLSSPIGMLPAGPTKEAPATTSPAKSNVSKTDQSTAMPLPGQANDHSVLLPNWTQNPKNSP